MFIIGLTGSIGMGKTEAANIFRKLGVPVHESDRCVHSLYRKEALPLIAKSFPTVIVNGLVDRKKLANEVFEQESKLHVLEDIIHPLVRANRRLFCERHRAGGERYVVLDIPLLFETRAENEANAIVLVEAPEPVQKSRVLSRPGMTLERFQQIMRHQIPSSEKRKRSHFILDSSTSLASASRQIVMLLRSLSSQ